MSDNNPPRDLLSLQYCNLEKIAIEFLKYAPSYAQAEAREAIEKVMDLQMQGIIRNGLYYIVLVDLVGISSVIRTDLV
jgi:hypothetical protein